MDLPLERHLRDLLTHALGHRGGPALVLHDPGCALARRLTAGYRAVLPEAGFLDFEALPAQAVLDAVAALPADALVVLVQSSRFTPRPGRFRVHLFQLGLRVVEHPHLARMAEDEAEAFIDALAHDPVALPALGRALQTRIDAGREIRLRTAAGDLVYGGPFEPARLNVGDYTGARHAGGQWPIGEVFTEPVDLEACAGRVTLHGYGAADFTLRQPPSTFVLEVAAGRVQAAPGAPEDFLQVLEDIRAAEGEVRVRELGFGLNPAFTRDRTVRDVGTYERVAGVHLSLGGRHAVYPKAGFHRGNTRFHVDVFCDLDRVEIDGETVWSGDAWRLP